MSLFEKSHTASLDALFAKCRRICLLVHSHPDGDALGSALALGTYLREKRGSELSIILPDPYPSTLDFLVEGEELIVASEQMDLAEARLGAAELAVCLDLNNFRRVGVLENGLAALNCRKLLIDHHKDPCRELFDLIFSETEISSTSELLFYLLKEMPDISSARDLPAKAANALMVGMTTDTNNFANSVFPSTLQMASELLAAGVDRDEILSQLYRQFRENRYRAMGCLCSDLLKITEDGVAYAVFRKKDMELFDLQDGETEGFVNIPLEIAKVRYSILLKEDDGYFRVSIRSKKGNSALELARTYFNGGGHECASGGRLYFPGDIASADEAEDYIKNVTARFLH